MIIGFTGHQRIDHPERWIWVRERFLQILEQNSGRCDWVLSALAAGGDQLFAETALSCSVSVEAVIPCDGYEATFDDPKDRERYELLLATASRITKLEFAEPSEDAYLAAGKYIVDRAEVLVALWNGKPAAGKGGTGDIVAYANKLGRRLIHVDPTLLFVSDADGGARETS